MNDKEYLDYLSSIPEAVALEYELAILDVIYKRMKYIKENELKEEDKSNDKKMLKAIASFYGAKILDSYHKVLYDSAETLQKQAKVLYDYRGIEQIPVVDNKDIERIIKADFDRFTKEFTSLSKGFVMNGEFKPISSVYQQAINKAVQSTATGSGDYYTNIRKTVTELGGSGVKVFYESGYTRRMDSSVRMNVLDGVRDVNAKIREAQGKEFGADGYEISVHGLSAPDHVNFQGRQYSIKDYEELNKRLKRPIGTLNCHHFATPIIMGVSEPSYNDEQLKEFKNKSEAEHRYKGKSMSGYETTQEQRRYELRLRKLKEQQRAFESVGDTLGAKQTKRAISQLNNEYKEFSSHVGLKPKPKRASIPPIAKNMSLKPLI